MLLNAIRSPASSVNVSPPSVEIALTMDVQRLSYGATLKVTP